MFEQYLMDASRLYEKSNNNIDEILYLRSVIFHLAGAVEAYVNDLPSAFEGSEKYSSFELDFLMDRTWQVVPQSATVKEITRFNSIKDKLKFLARKHQRDGYVILDAPVWGKYIQFKDFRDKLVHPREDLEDVSIEEYRYEASEGLKTIIELLNLLSQSIYRKPLRKRLLEIVN